MASGTTNTFTVGGAAVGVDAGLAGSPSGSDLTGATVTISSGTLQSGDTLNFTNQDGISGSYSAGVLTLSGMRAWPNTCGPAVGHVFHHQREHHDPGDFGRRA